MASPNDLINMIMNKKNNSKAVEDKEENELNLEDTLFNY